MKNDQHSDIEQERVNFPVKSTLDNITNKESKMKEHYDKLITKGKWMKYERIPKDTKRELMENIDSWKDKSLTNKVII